MRRLSFSLMALVSLAALGGCEQVVYVERSSCLSCHRPLQADGQAVGIEHAHPPVDGEELSCVDCHGGDPKARSQSLAHPRPGRNASFFLKNLTIGELDSVDPDYLRFVNPGDLRVAETTCGSGAGGGCHQGIVERVKTNAMATFSGELGVARYRAGQQSSGAPQKSIYDVRNPDFVAGAHPGTVGSLTAMEEPRVSEHESAIGPYQDLYLTKACMRCHLWSFGDNKFPGDFRSSGCTACHMTYGNDGLSHSEDPVVTKGAPPHPQKHTLVKAAPTEQCLHCHYRGGRIGPSFMGYREGAGPGLEGPRVGFLGEALHGHDANFYVTDEDLSNDRDETPPDIHFARGMHCVDCHTEKDVHGDGHIHSETSGAVEIRCEDCHGTGEQESTLTTSRGSPLPQLSRDAEGKVWMTGKVDGALHEVKQIKHSIEEAPHGSFMARSMGRDASGFSHLDELSCDTCHSGWMPNCYGCHVSVDMREGQRSLISGNRTPGRVRGTRKWVATDDLILMHGADGKITPSMPAEKMFFTAINGAGDTVIEHQVRTTLRGEVGHGQRAFHPHTTQRWSPFMRCERCHLLTTGENSETLDVVMGLGSDRYLETDGEGKVWALDRIQPGEGEAVVAVGHEATAVSAPLSQEVMERMRAVLVEPEDCPVPVGVAAPLEVIQDTIFTPSCASSGCHDSRTKALQLDLSAGNARDALVNRPSVVRPSELLVVPGRSQDSYLMEKVRPGGVHMGEKMPQNGRRLNACELAMLRGWINAGARP